MTPIPLTPYRRHVERWKGCTACPLHETRCKVVFPRGDVPCDVLFVAEAPGESENLCGKPLIGPAGKLFDQIVERAVGPVPLCATCGSVRYRPQQPAAGDDWTCKNGHRQSQDHGGRNVRCAFTNLLLCIPYDPDGTGKVEEPDPAWVEACRPRLEEFVRIARPKLVVAVGAYAREWLQQGITGNVRLPAGTKVIDVVHPAAILRMTDAQRGLAAQRTVIQIRNAVESL